MELDKSKVVKGLGIAILLSGMMAASALVDQNTNVDKPQAQENLPSQVVTEPRVYSSREEVSSRAANPQKPTTDFTYTVQQGDTLYDLALTYGVSVDQIMAANGLSSDKLSLGQKLLIPASGKVKVVKATAKAKTASEKLAPKTVNQVVSRSRYSGRAVGEKVAWSLARNIFAIGDIATVIDVETGYTFKIKRKGGHNHADCEPLTAMDTAAMKKIYGSWSWTRKAVVLVVDGKKIAASMAGMPHGSENIKDNKFNGHFDIHFYGSMTHGSEYTKSGKPLVDPDHQAMVRKASGQ